MRVHACSTSQLKQMQSPAGLCTEQKITQLKTIHFMCVGVIPFKAWHTQDKNVCILRIQYTTLQCLLTLLFYHFEITDRAVRIQWAITFLLQTINMLNKGTKLG